MPLTMFAAVGSLSGLSLVSQTFAVDAGYAPSISASVNCPSRHSRFRWRSSVPRPLCSVKMSFSGTSGVDQEEAAREDSKVGDDESRELRRSADWKAARAYKESGVIFDGTIEGFNGGGLLIRFYSLLGFLPYPLLSPSHSCTDIDKTILEKAKDLVGSNIAVKVVEANEDEKKLIFSEKDAMWAKFSNLVKVGDIFDAIVGSLEDYGAFAHLRFPDGDYHLTGLIHISEVSWDLVQDVRDFLHEGDQVKVKVTKIDREKSRISLSVKQLEEDPLLETLEKVIPNDGQFVSDSIGMSNRMSIEPLPGLDSICQELLQEDGITDVRLGRQGLEKRVVSQDLELWLSNVPAKDKQFTLLARAGRQVQEVYLTTTLDQDGIKKAIQRVLGRVL